jgi:hypothetical protein
MNVWVCHIMGHSMQKQQSTYSKFSKLLHTDEANIEDPMTGHG